MQTDPIGYGDGANWYNYAGTDPVNGKDPSGLACFEANGNYDDYSGDNSYQSCQASGNFWADDNALANAGWNVGDDITSFSNPLTGLFDFSFGSTSLGSAIPIYDGSINFDTNLFGNSFTTGLYSFKPGQASQNPRANQSYCSSFGYRFGGALDQWGGATKAAGTITVAAGGVIFVTTAITGVGAGAGGTVAAIGGATYLTGSAISFAGNTVKWLASGASRYDSGNLLSSMFEVPVAAFLGPVGRTVIGNVADTMIPDGLGSKNTCGE